MPLQQREKYGAHLVLILLLGLFLVQPYADARWVAGALQFVYGAIYVGLLFAVAANRVVQVIGVALAILTVVLPKLSFEAPAAIQGVGAVLAIVFMGLALAAFVWRVMRAPKVDGEAVSTALSVYLLMGVLWAAVYRFQYWLEPASFAAATGAVESSSLFYFSFVTQTTLGYGDITPVGAGAKSAAVLQAIVGQVYLVVLIARLVSLQLSPVQSSSVPAAGSAGSAGKRARATRDSVDLLATEEREEV